MRSSARVVTVFAIATLVSSLLEGTVTAAPAAPPPPKPVEIVGERPDVPSAQVAARTSGQRVEVTGERSEKTRTFVNPDGTLTTEFFTAPVHVQRGEEWVPFDPTLEVVGNDVRPRAFPTDLTFGRGGSTRLVRIGNGADAVEMAWQAPLPEPVLDGETATYAGVVPGGDLVMRLTRTGFTQELRLNERPDKPMTLRLPLTLSGLTVRREKSGSLSYVRKNGSVAAQTPAPRMWGAGVDEAGDPVRSAAVTTEIVPSRGGATLVLKPDHAFLSDPDVSMPISVDPGIHLPLGKDTWVYSPGQVLHNDASPELRVGRTPSTTTNRSYLYFPVEDYLSGRHILDAELSLYQFAAPSCTAKESRIYAAAEGNLRNGDIIWSTQPSAIPTMYGSSTAVYGAAGCTSWWVKYNLATLVDRWAQGELNNGGLVVRAANESDTAAYWRFRSGEYTGAQLPTLAVNYNSRPTMGYGSGNTATPCFSFCDDEQSTVITRSTRPVLAGAPQDADGEPVEMTYEIWNSAQTIKLTSGTGTTLPGEEFSWQVPANVLTNGGSYWWRTLIDDGTDLYTGHWTEFVVDTSAPPVPALAAPGRAETVWSGQDGDDVAFAITPATGGGYIPGYYYGINEPVPTTYTTSTSFTLKGVSEGPHTVYLQAIDQAGNKSPVRTYQLNVGRAGITSPLTGEPTVGSVKLSAKGDPAFNGGTLTWKWRRGASDSWTAMSGLVDASNVPLSNPLTIASGTATTATWDVAGAAGADGPVEIVAFLVNGTDAAQTKARQVVLDRTDFGASTATAEAGPATVTLATGNASISATDVEIDAYASDLVVSRTHNSRAPQASSGGPLGPGWVLSAGESITSDVTGLTVSGTRATLSRSDGDTLGFLDNGDDTFTSEHGAEDVRLAHVDATSSDPERYTTTDPAGTVTTFELPPTATDAVFRPVRVTQAGDPSSTMYDHSIDNGVSRVSRIMAPAPTGVTCSLSAPATRGCRSIAFAYAPSTQALPGDDGATWGDYPLRLREVTVTAWDPDAAASATKAIAAYAYDSQGRLRAVWDPRLPALKTTYDYDSAGHIVTLKPGAQEPWTFTYAAAVGDPDTGRLRSVSRSALSAGTATTTFVYGIPVSGTAAPHQLTPAELDRSGQQDRPVRATAVFPPTQVPNDNPGLGTYPSSYERATVHYLNASAKQVNHIVPGDYRSTVEYDSRGNVVRSLEPAELVNALNASSTDTTAEEAARSLALSTTNKYSDDGLDLLESFGPEHVVRLPDGSSRRARVHTLNKYDENSPGGAKHHLLTSTVTTANAGGVDYDARTTRTNYATATDWDRRSPTATVTDAVTGGLNLTQRTSYNSDGLVAALTLPGGSVNENTAHTTITRYYTASTHPDQAACGNRPEWVHLVCETLPAAQPTVATGLPKIPTARFTYNLLNKVRTRTDVVDGTAVRTVTTDYDAADRPWKTTTTGPGTALPVIETVYDGSTGYATKTRSLDGSAVPPEVVRVFDSLGRLTSYTDTDGNTTTTTYDLMSRPLVINDGKGTQTMTYDGGTERRGLLTSMIDSHAGTFAVSYDANARPVVQDLPNALRATTTYDEIGAAVRLEYTKTSGCTTACTWLSESVVENGHGEWATHASTLSQQVYGYDRAGRLTKVKDTYAGSCVTRAYTLDADSNRTSTATYPAGSGGVCQEATGSTTKAASYDAAARATTTGYVYDALGRTTTVPAADAGGAAVNAAYHVNDLVRSLTQGTLTKTWTLDVDQQRYRSWNDGTTARTNHYSDDSDSASWIAEGPTSWTRNILSPVGSLAAIHDSATGTTTLQLTNLHGDIVAIAPATGGTGLSATFEANEFGVRRTAGARRYAWTGGSRRSSDAVAGVMLMGVRLYNPITGRFLQSDPVPGGSDNAYDYAGHDSVNDFDLDGRCKTKHGSRWNPIGHLRSIRCRASHGVGHAQDAVAAAGRGIGRGMRWIGRKAWAGLRWFGRGLNAVGRGLKRFGAACARGVLPGIGAGATGYAVVNGLRSLAGSRELIGFGYGGWGIAATAIGSCIWSGAGALR